MERLTKIENGCAYIEFVRNGVNTRIMISNTIQPIVNKLADFEDFMEEIGAESLEEIKQLLIANSELTKAINGLDADYICKCLLEYPALNKRWQKLKEWSNEKGQSYLNGCMVESKMQKLEKE